MKDFSAGVLGLAIIPASFEIKRKYDPDGLFFVQQWSLIRTPERGTASPNSGRALALAAPNQFRHPSRRSRNRPVTAA